MSTKKQTVTVGGKLYDMETGKPLKGSVSRAPQKQQIISDIAAPKHSKRTVAPHAKQTMQRSTTLKRSALNKPLSPSKVVKRPVHKPTVQRSAKITKFASHTSETKPKKQSVDRELLSQSRALEKANEEYQASLQKRSLPISSRVIKEHLLGQAIEQVPTEISHKKKAHVTPKARFASVAMTSLALLVLGGYLTYLNIPNLSIRVAAANSGINASLPSYQPAGYQIHGPIAYQEGEVNVSYKQTGSSLGYKITQRPSDWDPLATLDNYVETDSKNDYQIHSVEGLTVYTYKKKAVWVNDGILHIIDGNAPLSTQQVERIVASM